MSFFKIDNKVRASSGGESAGARKRPPLRPVSTARHAGALPGKQPGKQPAEVALAPSELHFTKF